MNKMNGISVEFQTGGAGTDEAHDLTLWRQYTDGASQSDWLAEMASPLTIRLLVTPTILLGLPSPSATPGTRPACSTPLELCKRDAEPIVVCIIL